MIANKLFRSFTGTLRLTERKGMIWARDSRELSPESHPNSQHAKELEDKKAGKEWVSSISLTACLVAGPLSRWLLVFHFCEAVARIQVPSNHRNYTFNLWMLLSSRPFQNLYLFSSKPRREEIREGIIPTAFGKSTQLAHGLLSPMWLRGLLTVSWCSFEKQDHDASGVNCWQVYKLTIYFHLPLKLIHGGLVNGHMNNINLNFTDYNPLQISFLTCIPELSPVGPLPVFSESHLNKVTFSAWF